MIYIIISEAFAQQHNNTKPNEFRKQEGFNSAKLKNGLWACGEDMAEKFPSIFEGQTIVKQELTINDFELTE